MLLYLSFFVLTLFVVYLFGLTFVCYFRRDLLESFFAKFAQTLQAHLIEMAVRVVIGSSLLVISYQLYYSLAVVVFAYVLVASSVGLLFLPWSLHSKFASKVVPMAVAHAYWFGVGAFILALWMSIFLLSAAKLLFVSAGNGL